MALKGRRSTPEERLQAVRLLKEGNEAALVARMFNVSQGRIREHFKHLAEHHCTAHSPASERYFASHRTTIFRGAADCQWSL